MTDTSAEAIEEWAREFLEGADHMESIGDAEMEALYRKRAATLRALAAENAALRADAQEANDRAAGHSSRADRALHERDAAQAEARGLRELLGRAATYVELTYDEEAGEEAAEAKRDLDDIRAALKASPHD